MSRCIEPPDGLSCLAVPDGDGPHPAVVVIHDITGFRPDTVRHCERLAEAGFVAGAPNLFGGIGCVLRTLAHATRERVHPKVSDARGLLASRPDVDSKRVAVMGFCMGGGFAITAAASGDYAVALPFYGTVPASAESLRGICPTLGQFGQQDMGFRGQARRLKAHLTELGVPHEVITYADAGHSFMNDHRDQFPEFLGNYTPLRARYVPDVEAQAWTRMLAFLAEHMPPSADVSE